MHPGTCWLAMCRYMLHACLMAVLHARHWCIGARHRWLLLLLLMPRFPAEERLSESRKRSQIVQFKPNQRTYAPVNKFAVLATLHQTS